VGLVDGEPKTRGTVGWTPNSIVGGGQVARADQLCLASGVMYGVIEVCESQCL